MKPTSSISSAMIKNIKSHLDTQSLTKSLTRLVTTTALIGTLAFSSGCSLFSVYTIDIPQGTPLTQEQATKVKVGMSSNQVLYILGSPALTDTMDGNRWDYIYNFEAGTMGKRNKITEVTGSEQHLSIFFAKDKVVDIKGVASLP